MCVCVLVRVRVRVCEMALKSFLSQKQSLVLKLRKWKIVFLEWKTPELLNFSKQTNQKRTGSKRKKEIQKKKYK